ncbi:MAG: hypothetical protein V2I66_10070 [Halieaceae bacterium]|nr:hypothetical protein [Halieaceae bacterium]
MKLSMVHWLIAAALLANGAVFYWQQSRPETIEPAATGNSLRELKLLSEVEVDESSSSQRFREAESRSQPSSSSAPAARTAAPDPEVTDFDPPVGGVGNTGSPVAETPEAQPVSEAPPLAAADSLVSGTPAAGDPVAFDSASEVQDSEDFPPEQPPGCWLAGPVDNDALSEQLTVAFAAAGVSMDLVLQTTEVSPDNWVHVPTSGEQADVRRVSRELRQAGFDNFPINNGPLAGSLSMGLFRSEQRAIAMRDTLRGMGYEADIYERQAFAEQPWITLDESARVALDWPAVEGELPGYDDLRLLAVECPPQS